MDKPTLVVCGSIALDRIMSFTGRYKDLIKPDKIHVLSLSPLIDKLENSRGGVGANIAYNLAILDERPILLGSVGSDAKEYMKDLAQAGVDTSHIHYSPLPTASFNVLNDSDNNQVGGFYQGAMRDSDSLSFAPWQDKNVLVVISAHNPEAMNRQVQECREYNLPLVYDPGQQVTDPITDLAAGIETAQLLIVNDYEMGLLCDKLSMSPETVKAKVPFVITTLGKYGSAIEGKSVAEALKIPIAQPTQVIDPTGAGDAYRAGFLFGYLRQWDLRTCGQLGTTVASFAVENHGTQHSFSKQDIAKRYFETFNEEVHL